MKINLMIAVFLFLISPFLTNIFAAPCDANSFTDADKRDFGDKKPFKFDVDGDGKNDSITPRIYKTKGSGKVRENHWITFDLKTSQGKIIKSFFKYNYGNNLSDYWVYALVPCKIGGVTKNDLLFYTGDDGGDETVILENKGNSFKVYSRKETTN